MAAAQAEYCARPADRLASSGNPAGNETSAGTREANKATGPAEEEDEVAADGRGLTADSSPD